MSIAPSMHGQQIDSSLRRALIVEDDAAIRMLAARILRREGFSVDETADGAQALAQLKAGHRYDVILLDLAMPEMTGVQLIAHLRTHMPDLLDRIVVITANVHALRGDWYDGICHVLVKPFDIQLLLSTVHACTSGVRS